MSHQSNNGHTWDNQRHKDSRVKAKTVERRGHPTTTSDGLGVLLNVRKYSHAEVCPQDRQKSSNGLEDTPEATSIMIADVLKIDHVLMDNSSATPEFR